MERPLLAAIRAGDRAVLLVDELDRADDEFEAFLLEILSEFAVTIPEVGRDRGRDAARPSSSPRTARANCTTRSSAGACITGSTTRASTARSPIVRARAPHVGEALARDVAEAVSRLRELDLAKLPGVAETIDWANALAFLGAERLDDSSRVRHAWAPS